MLAILRRLILRLLGLEDLADRLKDLERQFVTKRNEQGQIVETLADVPLAERKDRRQKMAGMSWQQRQKWYEATDGGRIAMTTRG